MFCRNCGKPIPEDARFCMYCGTPVETATSEIEDQDVATEVLPEAENVYQTEPEAEATQPDDMFGGSDEVQEPEPEPVKKERPVFDEINWNVEEYPDSETVTKTEDVDFNWNANPADIPDPVRRRDYHDEPDPVTDFFKEGAEPEAEPVKEESFSGFTAPAADIIQPVDDIDIKLDSVIKGEEAVPAPDLFGDKPETEELSAAERIDKFYTFNRKNEEFQQLLNREYEKVRSGGAIGDELSRAGAIADERFEARETHEPQTMEELFEAEGIEKPYQPKAFESDVLQRIEAQELEREQKRKEEAARKAEIEKARKEAEEARLKREREAEEARIKAEADARIAAERAKAVAEREAREAQEAAEEARLKAEKEAKAREEEAARREAAEAKIRAEEEARRVAEEEARIKAEAVAKYQAQEEARIRAEEELKAAQEAAKIKAQQEARLAAEEQARFEAAKEARRLEEEEAKRRLEEEQKRLAREANESIAAEEARKVLEQTARMRDEEAAKIKAAVAGLRASTRAAVPQARKEVAEAHKATRDQINEMAKARHTFFGDIDLADGIDKAQKETPAPASKPEPAPVIEEPKQEEAPAKDPLVTGRETLLGDNLSDTRVFDKREILAGISDNTITANRDEFVGLAPGLAGTKISRKPKNPEYDTVDDLLSELENKEPEMPQEPAAPETSDFDLENLDLADFGVMGAAADLDETQTMEVPLTKEDVPQEMTEADPFLPEEVVPEEVVSEEIVPEEVVPEEVVSEEIVPEEAAEEAATDAFIPEEVPAEEPAAEAGFIPEEVTEEPQDLPQAEEPVYTEVEEPTMVFGDRLDKSESPADDLSGTRRFDEEFPAGSDKTDSTIVVGQMPETFADLPSNDFDDYGKEEAEALIRQQEEESAFNNVSEEVEEGDVKAVAAGAAGAAAAGAVALSRKEKKAADKEAKKAAKEAAREAKKAKKSAKSVKAAAADVAEEAEEEVKGGKGRTILIILLVLLCLVLAAEIVGIGVHYVAPQSRVAEIVDNQLNKVIHLITGEEEQEYQVLAADRREAPRDDYQEVVTEKANQNYKGLIETVAYDPELVYNEEQVADISDLVLSMPITEFEWGRTEENESVYYDEEVIGQVMAYESQKYALLKDGDESVLSMISQQSTKNTLSEKKNSNPDPFKRLDIGEIRVSGSYYYVWIREQIGDETKERVIKMFPESQFNMMVERGYDI